MPDKKKTTAKPKRFRNEKGKLEEFTVYIIHGHSTAWEKVDKYIRETLQFATVVSVNRFGGGNILRQIKKAIWFECDCAVAILSPDDVIKGGSKLARPNVMLEIGYCMGYWDYYYWEDETLEPVILIKEESVELASDLKGNEYIEYRENNIQHSFSTLGLALNNIYDYLRE